VPEESTCLKNSKSDYLELQQGMGSCRCDRGRRMQMLCGLYRKTLW
jgi:hypothetical protein